jgi:hypothetical protein
MKISGDNLQFHKRTRNGDQIEIAKSEILQTAPTRSPFSVIKAILVWIGAAIVVVAATALVQERTKANGFRASTAEARPESVKREANPSNPNATLVHAAGLNAAPGAIVCRDYEAVTQRSVLRTFLPPPS